MRLLFDRIKFIDTCFFHSCASKCFCVISSVIVSILKVHVLWVVSCLFSCNISYYYLRTFYFNISFTECPIRLVSPATSTPSPYRRLIVLYFLSCIVPSISLIIFCCVFLHIGSVFDIRMCKI